jgi:hypothetical protein
MQYARLANWKHKPCSHTLGPIQTISTIVEKFHVSLGYVCRCVSAPKMLESLWAIRFLEVSDAEAPEDVKTTLDVLGAAALVPYAALFWGLVKGTPVLSIAKRYGVSKE